MGDSLMAILYIDGFDAYGSADFYRRWYSTNSMGVGQDWIIDSTGGRYGTGCASAVGTTSHYIWHSLGASAPSFVVGFACKVQNTTISGQVQRLFQTVGNGHFGLEIVLSSAGGVQVRKFDGTVIIDYPAANIQSGVWYYYELKQTIASTVPTGNVVLRINGLVVGSNSSSFVGYLQYYSFGYLNGTEVTCDTVSLGSVQDISGINLGWFVFDDLYVLDLTGSQNNDFLGDVRVEAIHPSAPGTHTDFTVTGAASNWQAVADIVIDNDASYVAGNAVGNTDTYRFTSLSSVPTNVFAFQLSMVMRKDDAGARIVSTQVRSGGNDYTSGKQISVGDQYATYTDVWNNNPNGNVAWTGTSINALEAGVKIVG